MILTLDPTSVGLLVILLVLLSLVVFLRTPPPHAHPFILGRQSLPSRTRLENESPIYTNNAAGGLRAPVRPGKVKTLDEFLLASTSKFGVNAPEGEWVKGGEAVKDVVLALKEGVGNALGGAQGSVAVLVENPTDALLLTLALALTLDHKPILFSPGSAIPTSFPSPAAIIHSSAFSTQAQSLAAGSDSPPKVFVLGGEDSATRDWLATGQTILQGKAAAAGNSEETAVDVKKTVLTMVSEGIPLQLSHLNITASLVSWLSLFPGTPHSTRPTAESHILSYHSPTTPLGLGIALLALFSSSTLTLATLPSIVGPLTFPSAPPATIIFGSEDFEKSLNMSLLSPLLTVNGNLIKFSRFWKLRLLKAGVVSKTTIADSWLFSGPRNDLGLADLEAVFISAPIRQSRCELFRIFLGVPVVVLLQHAFGLAPIASGMMFDFQRLTPPFAVGDQFHGGELAAVGAPILGAEIKIRGREADVVAGKIRGEVLLRSPILPPSSTIPSSLLIADSALPQLPPYPSMAPKLDGSGTDESLGGPGIGGAMWLRTGIAAEMGKEGSLWELPLKG